MEILNSQERQKKAQGREAESEFHRQPRKETAMSNIDFASIEVSKKELKVIVQRNGRILNPRDFTNTRRGHGAVCKHLERDGRIVRAVLEASGVYSHDIATALSRRDGIEVMVLNPQAARNFARAMLKRSKNDKVDAEVLLEFVRRMPFKPFKPLSEAAYKLRAISRKMKSIADQRTELYGQLEAESGTIDTPDIVIEITRKMIRECDKAIDKLKREALSMIGESPDLKRKFELLKTAPGIAELSAVYILGELASLPDYLGPKQLVAFAGLDPVHFQSGTSVNKKKGISKRGNVYLRTSLYMPAMSAARHDPHIKNFYDILLARGKKPIVAQVAVMRKLLHSIYGMFKNDTPFDGRLFYRQQK
jgi:transposase